MPDDPRIRHVCVLLHDGRVLTDDEGRLSSYVDETHGAPWPGESAPAAIPAPS